MLALSDTISEPCDTMVESHSPSSVLFIPMAGANDIPLKERYQPHDEPDIHRIPADCDPETVYQDSGFFPTRYVIGLMALMSSTFAFIIRSSFSLNLLAMVNVYDENGTMLEQPDFGPRYNWTPYEQSLLLGALYYAYPIASVPSGLILDKYGLGRQLVFTAFILSAVAMLLSPFAASLDTFKWLFATRLFMGLMQGGVFPNIYRLLSRWAPRSELGMFTVSIHGSSLGTVLTWTLSGVIIESWGWQWAFYGVGILLALFLALWWWNVYDSPLQHPRIRWEELEFIKRSVPPTKAKNFPPLHRVAMSLPFWALLLLQFGNDWGLYFVSMGVPLFVNQVLGFKISSTGFVAALPYTVRFVSAILFGLFGDYVRSRGWVSLTVQRKAFCICSHILPALFLLAIPFAVSVDRPYLCIGLMTVSFALNGAVTQTSQANYHDLAPTCAATLMAIVCTVTATSGFLSPLVVAYFTSERNTIEEWRYVFMTGATFYMLPACFFICFGSAKDQNW